MESVGILLCLLIPLSFFGKGMNYRASAKSFCFGKCFLYRCIIVSVNRTDIVHAKIFEIVIGIQKAFYFVLYASQNRTDRLTEKR